MDFSTVFLQLVLYALEVAVHSQTYPYISFMGVSLRNNSYVDGNLVGDNSTHSVQCHTDLSTCCSSTEGIHRAGWSFPSGQTLGFINTGWGRVYMKRAAQRVELRRRNDLRIKGNGMYRCSIRTTAASDRVFVYVGLYTSGGENNKFTLFVRNIIIKIF